MGHMIMTCCKGSLEMCSLFQVITCPAKNHEKEREALMQGEISGSATPPQHDKQPKVKY